MYSLPDEQNKLLKELGDIDNQEREGIVPVRNNFNLFLLVLIWVMGILAAIVSVVNQSPGIIVYILSLAIALGIAFILAYYNFKIGFYLSAIFIVGLNGIVSYFTGFENNQVILLFDALTIFVFANQFGRSGFIAGYTSIATKIVVVFFIFNDVSRYEILIAHLINVFAIGIIPTLLLATSKVSRRAKKAEIRAEILALQNQDLITSWGSLFDKPPVNQPQAIQSPPSVN